MQACIHGVATHAHMGRALVSSSRCREPKAKSQMPEAKCQKPRLLFTFTSARASILSIPGARSPKTMQASLAHQRLAASNGRECADLTTSVLGWLCWVGVQVPPMEAEVDAADVLLSLSMSAARRSGKTPGEVAAGEAEAHQGANPKQQAPNSKAPPAAASSAPQLRKRTSSASNAKAEVKEAAGEAAPAAPKAGAGAVRTKKQPGTMNYAAVAGVGGSTRSSGAKSSRGGAGAEGKEEAQEREDGGDDKQEDGSSKHKESPHGKAGAGVSDKDAAAPGTDKAAAATGLAYEAAALSCGASAAASSGGAAAAASLPLQPPPPTTAPPSAVPVAALAIASGVGVLGLE